MQEYLNTIVNSRWETFLPLLPANSIDAIVTDPPYGTASDSKVQKNRDELVEFNLSWDASLPLEWLEEAYRVLKPGGSLVTFTDNKVTETVWKYIEDCGLNPLQHVYWRKLNPPPQPRKNFCSAIETAIFARKPGKIVCWNGGGITHNVIEAPICNGPERTPHPTQKPLIVMAKLVQLVCPVGGVVFDPFIGSGTTAEAAINLDRNFIGCEVDPTYHAIALNRIVKAVKQPKLFIAEDQQSQLSMELAS